MIRQRRVERLFRLADRALTGLRDHPLARVAVSFDAENFFATAHHRNRPDLFGEHDRLARGSRISENEPRGLDAPRPASVAHVDHANVALLEAQFRRTAVQAAEGHRRIPGKAHIGVTTHDGNTGVTNRRDQVVTIDFGVALEQPRLFTGRLCVRFTVGGNDVANRDGGARNPWRDCNERKCHRRHQERQQGHTHTCAKVLFLGGISHDEMPLFFMFRLFFASRPTLQRHFQLALRFTEPFFHFA